MATKKVWECRKKCVLSWKIGKIGQVMWHCSALSCGETERVEIPRNSAKIRWKSAARKNRAGKWHAVFGRRKKRAEKVRNFFFHGCGKFVVWTTPLKSVSCTKFPLEKCEKTCNSDFCTVCGYIVLMYANGAESELQPIVSLKSDFRLGLARICRSANPIFGLAEALN